MSEPTKGKHQHGVPLHIDRLDDGATALSLERIAFSRDGGSGDGHDEGWLQKLIFRVPQALPIQEVEPGFGALVPICLELPVSAGFIDNLFLTGDGDIVVVECKLWKNPEARREVVAQILDYAHALSSWSYQDLERATLRGARPDGQAIRGSLFGLVSDSAEVSGESRFVDAVSRNLRLGRMLLLIVGDGIREGAETLAAYLQSHAGFHFTLGLIEMPLFRLPTGGFVLQPRILARTVNIERGIVRVVEGRAIVEPAPQVGTGSAVRTSLTQERIAEAITAVAPEFPGALRAFLAMAEADGIFIEPAQKSIIVRCPGPDDRDLTLGAFDVTGRFQTYMVNWPPGALGCVDVAHDYLEELAALVGGKVRRTPKPVQWYVVTTGGQVPEAMEFLRRPEEWLVAIRDFVEAMRKAAESRVGVARS